MAKKFFEQKIWRWQLFSILVMFLCKNGCRFKWDSLENTIWWSHGVAFMRFQWRAIIITRWGQRLQVPRDFPKRLPAFYITNQESWRWCDLPKVTYDACDRARIQFRLKCLKLLKKKKKNTFTWENLGDTFEKMYLSGTLKGKKWAISRGRGDRKGCFMNWDRDM